MFVQNVARNRGTTAEDVKMNFGKGGVFIGENAVAARLADGVMSLDELCEKMKEGTSFNGGAAMATNVKGAEGGKPEAVDMEAVKAQAVADYKARVASIEEVFAGLDIAGEEKAGFVDGDKTVAEATAFALAKAKEKIKSQAEDLVKAKAKPSATDEKNRALAALENSAAAQNSVHGGSDAADESKKRAEWAAEVSEKFYKKG